MICFICERHIEEDEVDLKIESKNIAYCRNCFFINTELIEKKDHLIITGEIPYNNLDINKEKLIKNEIPWIQIEDIFPSIEHFGHGYPDFNQKHTNEDDKEED